MVTIISLGTCSLSLIYPLIFLLVAVPISEVELLIDSRLQKQFLFTTSISLMFLAEALDGSLYFIFHYKKKKVIGKHIVSTAPSFSRLKPEKQSKYSKVIILSIFGLGALDLIATLIMNYCSNAIKPTYIELRHTLIECQFFLYIALSIPILHQQIYLHHYTSIGITIIGVILIMIPLFSVEFQWLNFILTLIRYCLNAGLFISEKWLMHYKNINPFFLLLLQGIFGLAVFGLMIILIVTLCPTANPEKPKWYCNDIIFFSLLDGKGISYLLVELIRSIIINIAIIQTIKEFTPFYYISVVVLSNAIEWIIVSIIKQTQFTALTLVGYLIIIIGFLIFNETIILHFCKLEFNTAKMITKRSQLNYLQQETSELDEALVIDN